MQDITREIMKGEHVGRKFWICHYNRPDLNKKPLRNVPPTLVVVVDNDELPKGKKVYYSQSHFRPLKSNGEPTSKIIGAVDNTGFRMLSGTPLFAFTDELSCRTEWGKQIATHIKMVQGKIDNAAKYWESEKEDLLKMFHI